jgi:hypothetical protein
MRKRFSIGWKAKAVQKEIKITIKITIKINVTGRWSPIVWLAGGANKRAPIRNMKSARTPHPFAQKKNFAAHFTGRFAF